MISVLFTAKQKIYHGLGCSYHFYVIPISSNYSLLADYNYNNKYLFGGAVPHDDFVSRIKKILDDSRTHNAQSKKSKFQ